MNKAILHPEVQEYIRSNRKQELTSLILKGSPFSNVSPQELAVQINGLNKAEKKLPTWFNNQKIIYPPNLNLEQTSSEKTAQYKASLVAGAKLADITGGFGIDDYFFSKIFSEVFYCEINPELAETAAHNFKTLKADNIHTFSGDGLAFLKNSPHKYDWIYADPSRRDDRRGKVFFLSECLPNIPVNLEFLFSKAGSILIKTSPLLDLKAGIKELQKVLEIHIVAVNDDVKELLFILNEEASEDIIIKTINFKKKRKEYFEASFNQSSADPAITLPRKYLYEPNPAVMKSGLFAELARQTSTCKLHQNSHLFTSEELNYFPGRYFEIIDYKPFNRKQLKKEFKNTKANITTRNFPETVDSLREKIKIREGGNTYLFFTTNAHEEKIVLICRKTEDAEAN